MTLPKDRRSKDRINLSLPVSVQSKESADHEWFEWTTLSDVSPFGAKFPIVRPTESGRVLLLTLEMPWQLRCYDYEEKDYKVWAVVRHVTPIEGKREDNKKYEVGVAFVGKEAPASYHHDPALLYEIEKPTAPSGMWGLKDKFKALRKPSDAVARPLRVNVPIEVTLEVFDNDGIVVERERTITKNISWRGAAVLSRLKIEKGRFLKISSVHYPIGAVAVVRARRKGSDGVDRLHVEFLNWQWPMEAAGLGMPGGIKPSHND